MSGLCNAEASIASGDTDLNPIEEYNEMATMANQLIDELYKELNLT